MPQPAATDDAVDAPVSLRSKHSNETRQRIVEVALARFAEHGFDATTVEEIAAAADISPRTFFRYFPTKDAVLFDKIERHMVELCERIEQRPNDEPAADTLVAVLTEMVEQLHTSPEERALVRRLLDERPALRGYQRLAIAAHSEGSATAALARHGGVSPDDLGLRTMVAAVAACFDVALRDWAGLDDPPPFRTVFRGALDACAAAFPRLA